ncbi:homeodomain-interacting protein kinase 2-like isoform X2 [Paralichthys olivaceus]|uniref:homeodomain-interacting protein kinase 2-like isoform X2 n=1 Tax=Paralichthys olivaceus TaxID=8255 RepID=UPI003753DD1A
MTENLVSHSCLTANKADEQMQSGDSEVPQSNILCSGTNSYLITEVCGEGAFGKVVKAVNMATSQEVALKILKREDAAPREMWMLKAVSALDPTKSNVVDFIERFQDGGQTCLVFERLDMNLYQLLQQRRGHPLTLSEIRPIAHQLLTTFAALESIGVIHTDLKPDNVMLVNHEREPFRVKLIDFGVSFMRSENTRGMKTQPIGFRSPEVTLGLPVSEAIDMWGLGCILLFLYLANHPFSVDCEYQGMKGIVDMLGQPDDDFLKAGIHSHQFFMEDKHWCNPGWSIKTPSEFESGTGIQVKEWASDIGSLNDLITLHPVLNGSIELQDRRAFVSLLKGLLQIDPRRRLTPQRGLSHPFLTMVHLMDNMESPYVMHCLDSMGVLDLDDYDDEEDFCSDVVAEEDPWVEEASVVPQSEDTGSAPPHSSIRVEELDPPCDEDAAAGSSDVVAEEDPWVEEASVVQQSEDTGSDLPHSSVRVEELDLPCDDTAAAGSDAEKSAESQQLPDAAQETQLCEDTRPARVSRLKRMRKFFGRIVKKVKRLFR